MLVTCVENYLSEMFERVECKEGKSSFARNMLNAFIALYVQLDNMCTDYIFYIFNYIFLQMQINECKKVDKTANA